MVSVMALSRAARWRAIRQRPLLIDVAMSAGLILASSVSALDCSEAVNECHEDSSSSASARLISAVMVLNVLTFRVMLVFLVLSLSSHEPASCRNLFPSTGQW